MRQPSVFRVLIGVTLVASAALGQPASAPTPAAAKWSPPVVDLLVDPWSPPPVAAGEVRSRWVPSSVDIVDPWADQAATAPPHVASRSAGGEHSTIF